MHRTLYQRGMALVYLIAFVNAENEFKPLLGEQGLLPVTAWVTAVAFRASPSLECANTMLMAATNLFSQMASLAVIG